MVSQEGNSSLVESIPLATLRAALSSLQVPGIVIILEKSEFVGLLVGLPNYEISRVGGQVPSPITTCEDVAAASGLSPRSGRMHSLRQELKLY